MSSRIGATYEWGVGESERHKLERIWELQAGGEGRRFERAEAPVPPSEFHRAVRDQSVHHALYKEQYTEADEGERDWDAQGEGGEGKALERPAPRYTRYTASALREYEYEYGDQGADDEYAAAEFYI